MHDLGDHLARGDRLHHLLADRLGLHGFGDVAHHVERHIGFEQRAAHLAHRLVDVSLGQRALAGELIEDDAKAF